MLVGIVGLGFVGTALQNSFNIKNVKTVLYDKYKEGGIGDINKLLDCNIIFLCLPTEFDKNKNEYNKDSLYEICNFFYNKKFNGLIAIKSTMEPDTTRNISEKYKNLKVLHNPEFLSSKTSFEDFHNQKHIVLGRGPNCEDVNLVYNFYKEFYPSADISVCTSNESESMKIMCNSFYSSKIMIFNEFYLLCKKNNTSFENVKNLMLKNKWINKMHTEVPGSDGKLAYGGACLTKDTNALISYMKKKNTMHTILECVSEERNFIRDVPV